MSFEYPLMEPPFEVPHYKDMTIQEAKQLFDWYIAEIPNRIELLLRACRATGGQLSEKLDFTSDSLILIWDWYKNKIKTIPRSTEEINAMKQRLPLFTHGDIKTWDLDRGTQVLAMDISIYFAEIFVRQFPNIKWGYLIKPKSHVDLNQPILIGFKNNDDMNPRTIVINLVRKEVEGKQHNGLIGLFNVWRSFA